MNISRELYDFIYSQTYQLALYYNEAILHHRLEYEKGFHFVMNKLHVPVEEQSRISSFVALCANASGIPLHRLSPVNQFITAIPGYIQYCIDTKIPESASIKSEASELALLPEFSRYVQETIGMEIAQKVKGALHVPFKSISKNGGCLSTMLWVIIVPVMILIIVVL